MPTDADTVPLIPVIHANSDLVDCPGDFVPRNARIRDAREQALFRHHITVANSASLDANPDFSRPRVWDLALNNLEISPGSRYLNSFHLRHSASPTNLRFIATKSPFLCRRWGALTRQRLHVA